MKADYGFERNETVIQHQLMIDLLTNIPLRRARFERIVARRGITETGLRKADVSLMWRGSVPQIGDQDAQAACPDINDS